MESPKYSVVPFNEKEGTEAKNALSKFLQDNFIHLTAQPILDESGFLKIQLSLAKIIELSPADPK